MATAAELANLASLLEAHKSALEDIDTADDVQAELAEVNSNLNRLTYRVGIIQAILDSVSLYTDAEKLQLIADTLGPQDQ